MFAVQDEVTQAVVATPPGRLEDAGADRARGRLTEYMTAYDDVLHARRHGGIDRI